MSYYPELRLIKKISPDANPQRIEIESRKPYRFPKQYISYQTFLEIVVSADIASNSPSDFDPTTAHFYNQCNFWDGNDTPIYGLSRDTIALFQESKIDATKDLFENLPASSNRTNYCILLPSRSFPTLNGHYIEILWIECNKNSTPDEKLIQYEFGNGVYGMDVPGNSQKIAISGMDTNGRTFCSFAEYPRVEEKIGDFDGDKMNDLQYKIVSDLRHLALQIVMAIEFLPEAIIVATTTAAISKGFGKKTPAANFWNIRAINIEPKRYIVKPKSSGSGESERQSPRPHWRKWHWRRVAVGAERKGREWRLISNTYVNPAEN
ncbi:hypothetical protein [Chamaesiphon polymorphus]|uniref:Uncharacterized protein n=1 Tax=Chamaesiphon polymorphus CCALA 037 TaxID=2107692 RepID=A0A2T1GFB6_9CYAN|nr:hypothetical protein [Chamaesiphon polymorphus]PSB56220.1 hypothetical protein C7B77_12545 [Chamaesiphon polymorphus CCALA 037]